MEHKFRDDDSDVSRDEELDFAAYLERKVKECLSPKATPPSEMSEIAVPEMDIPAALRPIPEVMTAHEDSKAKFLRQAEDQKWQLDWTSAAKREIQRYPGIEIPVEPANAAVASLSSNSSSEMVDADVPKSQTAASAAESAADSAADTSISQVADEKLQHLEIHGVEGYRYVTSTALSAAASLEAMIDEEAREVYNQARILAAMMTPEAVIQHTHRLERQRYLFGITIAGNNSELEELLKRENFTRRAELIELRSKLTRESKRQGDSSGRVASRSKTSSSAAKTPKKKFTTTGPKTKDMKAIDMLKDLGMGRKWVEDKLRLKRALDEAAIAYLDIVFADDDASPDSDGGETS